MSTEARPPFPPFTRETALQKAKAAEAAWNTRDPDKVAWRTPKIPSGATAMNSSRAATPSRLSSAASGPKNSTIDS